MLMPLPQLPTPTRTRHTIMTKLLAPSTIHKVVSSMYRLKIWLQHNKKYHCTLSSAARSIKRLPLMYLHPRLP